MELFIGLMSGTSMDAIDAALVRLQGNDVQLLQTHSLKWPDALLSRMRLLASSAHVSLRELGKLNAETANLFAQSVLELLEKAQKRPDEISAIGSHGQTLCHFPQDVPAFSMQIGDPGRIAELTGITTVGDFRNRDLAAGGQGAPLVPAFHQAIFAQAGKNRAILNIGGIANITLLPGDETPVRGYDTGPGNCLMDHWARCKLGTAYDVDGQFARSGQVAQELLNAMQSDPFFSLGAPKSTGTEYFSAAWLESMLQCQPDLAAEDVQSTLLELTATTISNQARGQCAELFICGGGALNLMLMERLAELLPQVRVATTAELGVDPLWVEAQAFAWLASRTLRGLPGNLPSVTGASRPVILGGIYRI